MPSSPTADPGFAGEGVDHGEYGARAYYAGLERSPSGVQGTDITDESFLSIFIQ